MKLYAENTKSNWLQNKLLTSVASEITVTTGYAQVVETSVAKNNSSQNCSHPDDHTIRTTDTCSFGSIFRSKHSRRKELR